LDHVLDAGAIIAHLEGEAGGEQVEELMFDPAERCLVHSVNIVEVHYHVTRLAGEPAAAQAISELVSNGVIIRSDLDEAFWESVSRLKVKGNISIADCFCIALAQRLSAEVVTTDHRDFDPLVPLGLCRITFIR